MGKDEGGSLKTSFCCIGPGEMSMSCGVAGLGVAQRAFSGNLMQAEIEIIKMNFMRMTTYTPGYE